MEFVKFAYLDRKKDLVKLRHGEYIALGNIEAVLKTSQLCDNLCIFADQNELSCVAGNFITYSSLKMKLTQFNLQIKWRL